MKLQNKIMLVMGLILIVVFGALSFLIGNHMQDTLENQMGNNAMDMAVTVAALDEVKITLAYGLDYQPLQDRIERIKAETRFQYIIVMDMEGIQYTYPYANGLNKPYKNGGEDRVLNEGTAYVSADRNVLFSAIRAFVPVYHEDRQVGAVLVGLLTDRVQTENAAYLRQIHMAIIATGITGFLGAILLARNIKRSTYGLEPKEIALLLGEREIVLESLKLGILAVNRLGQVVWVNQVAVDDYGIPKDLQGQAIADFYPKLGEVIDHVFDKRAPLYNEKLRVDAWLNLLCSFTLTRTPNGDISGVVVSFESVNQVKKMAEELIGYKRMTDALRAQNHEFMNKLQTISGLIQLDELEEALDFISDESSKRSDLASMLSHHIKPTHVAAILLAKYNQVTEAKYDLVIDPASRLTKVPDSLNEDELCSIIGNLIDNAQEAFQDGVGSQIKVSISELISGVRIEISDNGPGIPKGEIGRVFTRGVTSKSGSRGIGLSIVSEIIDGAGGSINVESQAGTLFIVDIPWT